MRRTVEDMEQVVGPARLRRIGGIGFPVAEFVAEPRGGRPAVLARLGRSGWFRVFFGRGRLVELADGTRWRVEAAGSGPFIVPMVTSREGKLAVAAAHGKRSYGVNGRDYAYNLYPSHSFGLRKPTWALRHHETELATFGAKAMYAEHPVPLAAALLCFTLIAYGVPGESTLSVPELRWA